MTHYIVVATCPDIKTAQALASILVQARLAACVNIIPAIRSIYEWEGKIENEEESLLLIKSREDHYPALEQAIVKHHPYEVPEILALPIEKGLPAYLGWLDAVLEKKEGKQ